MLKWRLKELLAEYQYKTGEALRYDDINAAIGISPNTLSMIATNKAESVNRSTLDHLLSYLSLKLRRELTPNDILGFESSAPITNRLGQQHRAELHASDPFTPSPNSVVTTARQRQRDALVPAEATEAERLRFEALKAQKLAVAQAEAARLRQVTRLDEGE